MTRDKRMGGNVSNMDDSAVLSYMLPAHSLMLDVRTDEDNIIGNNQRHPRNKSRGGRTDMDEQSQGRQRVYTSNPNKMNIRVRSLHSRMFPVVMPGDRKKSRAAVRGTGAHLSQMVAASDMSRSYGPATVRIGPNGDMSYLQEDR